MDCRLRSRTAPCNVSPRQRIRLRGPPSHGVDSRPPPRRQHRNLLRPNSDALPKIFHRRRPDPTADRLASGPPSEPAPAPRRAECRKRLISFASSLLPPYSHPENGEVVNGRSVYASGGVNESPELFFWMLMLSSIRRCTADLILPHRTPPPRLGWKSHRGWLRLRANGLHIAAPEANAANRSCHRSYALAPHRDEMDRGRK